MPNTRSRLIADLSFRAAPPIRIAEMPRALRAIAPQKKVQRRRLDSLLGINMAYLHKRTSPTLIPTGMTSRAQTCRALMLETTRPGTETRGGLQPNTVRG